MYVVMQLKIIQMKSDYKSDLHVNMTISVQHLMLMPGVNREKHFLWAGVLTSMTDYYYSSSVNS